MPKFLRLYKGHIINLDRVSQIYLDFQYDEFHKRTRDIRWWFEFDTQIAKSKTFETMEDAFAWFEEHVLPLINETN